MFFTKAGNDGATYEHALADAKAKGHQIVKVVTDRPEEQHIVTKLAGRTHRIYFDGPAIAKAGDLSAEAEAMEWITLRAAGIKETEGCTATQALQRARKEHALQTQTMTKEGQRQALAALTALNKRTQALAAEYGIATEEKEPDMSKQANTPEPNASFAKTVNDIRSRDKCGHMEAFRKARHEDAQMYALYQHAPDFPVVLTAEQRASLAKAREASATFEKHANDIMERDGCSRQQALRTCRTEFPVEYAAFQRA